MFFGFSGASIRCRPRLQYDIQDAGYRTTLDGVDFAPIVGWSPSGSVEVIVGHCYIVWTRDDHYAKFRVTEVRPATSTSPSQVVFDWAYQVDAGNRELRASKAKNGERGATRPIAWIQLESCALDVVGGGRRGPARTHGLLLRLSTGLLRLHLQRRVTTAWQLLLL